MREEVLEELKFSCNPLLQLIMDRSACIKVENMIMIIFHKYEEYFNYIGITIIRASCQYIDSEFEINVYFDSTQQPDTKKMPIGNFINSIFTVENVRSYRIIRIIRA